MADVYVFVYYECLQEFQRSITTAITHTDVNVDRLTEKARKKGLIPAAGYYIRPEAGKLVASREKKIVTLVSRCIESVKINEDLFQSFLALLDDAGLQHLVRRIRRRLSEQGGDTRPKRPAKAPPPIDDSAISVSVSSPGASQPLPPLPEIPTTFPSLQSPTHDVGASRQSDQKMLRSATRQHSKSSFDYEAVKEESVQPLTSPTHSSMSSVVPMEETAGVPNNMSPRPPSSQGFLLEKRQAKVESTLQPQTQKWMKERQGFEKKLEEKEKEINRLRADHQDIDKQIKSLQKQMGKDKETLESLRKRIAQLERELEKKDKDNEKLRKFSSDCEQLVQNHEREIKNLRQKLFEEKTKAEKKEIQIQELKNQLLQKELEKLKILDEYKDKERALERERDTAKVELARLQREMIQKEYKEEKERREQKEAECMILQQEKEEEERKRREAEQGKEEEELRRKAAEKGHRKSLAELQESLAELNELKEKLNLNT